MSIELAVIGCGRWGPNHIRTFANLAGANVRYAVDLAEDRLARIQKRFPTVKTISDYSSILDDPRLSGVVVATPTSTHFEIVANALRAGKHVLCEKPLCTTAREASQLRELAETSHRVLMVGHIFLFNAGIEKVKALVNDGTLGKLEYLAAVRTNLGPIRHDVNAAFDLATHDIAIFNWLTDATPLRVSAVGGAFLQPSVEDVVFVTLTYPDGVLGHIHASWLNPQKVRHITVVGTNMMVTWNDLRLTTPVALFDKGAQPISEPVNYAQFLRIAMWDNEIRLPRLELPEPLQAQNAAFLEAIRGGDCERSGARFSEGVVQTLEAISLSLKGEGKPVGVGGIKSTTR